MVNTNTSHIPSSLYAWTVLSLNLYVLPHVCAAYKDDKPLVLYFIV